MERRRPNRELKNSEDVQDALIEDYFKYDDLSRMEADGILMNISEIESLNYKNVELWGYLSRCSFLTNRIEKVCDHFHLTFCPCLRVFI
jgi:homoserine trans-succinylase